MIENLLDVFLFTLGLVLIYRAVGNIFSFPLLFWIFTLPVVFSAVDLVQRLFCLSILAWGASAVAVNAISSTDSKAAVQQFRSKPLMLGMKSPNIINCTVIICFLLYTAGSIYYFYKVGVSLFTEDVGLERLLRRHATSGSYFFQRLFRVGMPILCIAYYCMGKCHLTNHLYKRWVFFCMVLLTCAFLIFTGLRGNIVIFFFTPFMVAFGFLINRGHASAVIPVFIFTMLGGLLVNSFMYRDANSLEMLTIILQRLTGGASDGISYVVMEDSPARGLYYGETYFNDLMSLFYKTNIISESYVPFGAYLAESMLGTAYGGEQAAVYFVGELYANFGIFGVILGSLFFGAALQMIYLRSLKIKKTILRFAFITYLSAVILAILGGPTIAMTIDYVVTAFGFYIFSILVAGTLSVFSSRTKVSGVHI